VGVGLTLATFEARRGWRQLVPVLVLVTAVVGVVVWSASAARRTDTAFERMLADTAAWDVLVNPDNGASTGLTTEMIASVDGVADVSRIEGLFAFVPDATSLDDLMDFPGVLFATDGGSGYRLARPIVVDGAVPPPDDPDSIVVDTEMAGALNVSVGDSVRLRLPTGDEAERLFSAADEAAAGRLLADPSFAPVRDLRVAAVARYPDTVAVDGGFALPAAMATPALFDELGRPAVLFGGWHVRLDDAASVDQVRTAVDELVPDETIVYQTMSNVRTKVERGTRPPAVALTLFAAVVLVLGVLLIGQSVQRWLAGRSAEGRILQVLGSSRAERWRSGMVQIAVVTGVGVVLGTVAAVALSPLAPVGPARLVETSSGFHVDPWIVVGGAMALGGVILLVAAAPAWWWADQRASAPASTGPSRLSAVVDRAGLPLTIGAGMRFALDPVPGRRGSQRLAVLGAFTGVLLAAASIVFTASIDHLTSTPRLYGTNWSAALSIEGEQPEVTDGGALVDRLVATALADPVVSAASSIHAGEMSIDGRRTPVVAFGSSDVPVGATIIDGRAPTAADEVALAASTLERAGASIGERVEIRTPTGVIDAEVVGTTVLPAVGRYSGADKTSMGEGALVDDSLLDPLSSFFSVALVLEPGSDLDALVERLSVPLADLGRPYLERSVRPSEVTSLEALAAVPRWLAAAVALLVGVPVVHSLVLSVRGRRRDLAVLSVLGAGARSLRGISTVQGLTVVAAASIVGVPLGIVLGRLLWSMLATSFGTVAEPVVPAVPLVALSVGVLAGGALIGALPMWRSSRGATVASLRPE
jgi:ABC-type lipoprotein release transport system permease subunit